MKSKERCVARRPNIVRCLCSKCRKRYSLGGAKAIFTSSKHPEIVETLEAAIDALYWLAFPSTTEMSSRRENFLLARMREIRVTAEQMR